MLPVSIFQNASLFTGACRSSWLFAQTFAALGTIGLIVYRSVVVRDDDPIYSEVKDFIDSYKFEVAWKGRFLDVKMMFGQGELSIHLASADGQPLMSIDPAVVEELRQRSIEIFQEEFPSLAMSN